MRKAYPCLDVIMVRVNPIGRHPWYSKVHGANMGPIWGRQEPGGLHVGPMNFAIWDLKRKRSSEAWYRWGLRGFKLQTRVSEVCASLNGHVRLGVRYIIIFFYVQIWIRLPVVSYRGKKVRPVASPTVRSVNKSHDTKLRPKWARVCKLCPLHHSFIVQSPMSNSMCSDMANTPQLQSSWRWPLWRYRSP